VLTAKIALTKVATRESQILRHYAPECTKSHIKFIKFSGSNTPGRIPSTGGPAPRGPCLQTTEEGKGGKGENRKEKENRGRGGKKMEGWD